MMQLATSIPITRTAPQVALSVYKLAFDVAPNRDSGRWVAGNWFGSLWRGCFGRALRAMTCVTGLDKCDACPMRATCHYPNLFSGRLPSAEPTRYRFATAPNPYVIEVNEGPVEAGGTLELTLTLVGDANASLPLIVAALHSAGATGLTMIAQSRDPGAVSRRKECVKFELSSVTQLDWQTQTLRQVSLNAPDGDRPRAGMPPIPPLPKEVTVQTQSPWRLLSQGRLLTPSQLTPPVLLGALVRRIGSLANYYCDEPQPWLPREVLPCADDVSITDNRLQCQSATRFSARQRKSLRLDGLTGTFSLSGAGLEMFWPWLWVGQWTHIGKSTSQGLGAYRVTHAA